MLYKYSTLAQPDGRNEGCFCGSSSEYLQTMDSMWMAHERMPPQSDAMFQPVGIVRHVKSFASAFGYNFKEV